MGEGGLKFFVGGMHGVDAHFQEILDRMSQLIALLPIPTLDPLVQHGTIRNVLDCLRGMEGCLKKMPNPLIARSVWVWVVREDVVCDIAPQVPYVSGIVVVCQRQVDIREVTGMIPMIRADAQSDEITFLD